MQQLDTTDRVLAITGIAIAITLIVIAIVFNVPLVSECGVNTPC